MDTYEDDLSKNTKIYIKNVLLTDNIKDFLPQYLAFSYIILELKSVPLKIDRDNIIDKKKLLYISNNITRQVLTQLVKTSRIADVEFEKLNNNQIQPAEAKNLVSINRFFQKYNDFLSVGCIHETNAQLLNDILTVFRVYSLKNYPYLISFEHYLKTKQKQQDKMYYIHLDSLSLLPYHPALDMFRQNDVDVLIFTGTFTEGCIGNIENLEGNTLVNIAKDSLKIYDLALLTSENGIVSTNQIKKIKQQQAKLASEFQTLIEFAKKHYGQKKVEEVRMSNRTLDSPSLMLVAEDGFTASLEKMLKLSFGADTMANEIRRQAKIMELNAESSIIVKLNEYSKDDKKFDQLRYELDILYEITLLTAGFAISNPELILTELYISQEKRLSTA